MTSKLTRERLEELAAGQSGFNLRIATHEESKELARIALAAMDSEPVIVVGDDGGDALSYRRLIQSFEPGTKLYLHAQTAPEREQLAIENFRSAMEGIGHIRRTLEETFGGLHGTHVEPDVLAECKAICDAIYAAYRHAQPAPVVPEDFDFNRFNDVVWLECVASNPHMHSPTTSAIARVALELNKRSATMEAEPDRNPVLAYADSYRDMAKQGVDSVSIWSVITDIERNIAPLYRHAQPVPRVPDGYVMVPVKPTREILDEFDSIIDYGAEDSEDAWRRLLAAAPQSPGSEPATVPGKWIPVSEQMPEDRTQVILWDAEIGEVTSGHYSHKTHTFYHCGDAIENEITHWMAPPAAPQEVSDA
ncbi:TPA: DUF551 domain-containing protein [Klebsiella pneumoniae]|nr:DUF551 domain-containing protein [Klebsiella pneumoniae]HBR0745161.1 DUF551 domain-containing protein [Klebsiella pneumoniae]